MPKIELNVLLLNYSVSLSVLFSKYIITIFNLKLAVGNSNSICFQMRSVDYRKVLGR